MSIIGKAQPEDTGLHPIHYQWAYDLYQQGIRNTWFPHEIALKEDLMDFEKMTEDEKFAVKYIMSFFNPAELIVNRSIALGLYRYIKAPEAHLFLARWMYEEANHCVSFEYVLETFPFDRDEIYTHHTNVPEMKAKEDFINKYMKKMTDDSLDIESIEGKKDFLRNLVATNLMMEGIWFYSGFMVILSFRQRNILRNFGSLVDWVLRDESLHLKFGMQLIHTVIEENPEILTEEFAQEIQDLIIAGVEIEINYNKALFPNGILGLNSDYVNEYVKYVADRRLQEIGLPKYYNASNPAKWMSTATDVLELVNFFEMQNTKYEADSHSSGSEKRNKDQEIIEQILKGGVGVIPTDTIYGIVGSALNKKSVEKIYEVRKRNNKKPCLILISDIKNIDQFTSLSALSIKMLKKIWPERITVVLVIIEKKKQERFKYLHKGTETLAFRIPKNEWLQNLLKKTGPLIAPSANLEGKPPAKNIDEAKKYFGENCDFYMSGKISKTYSTLIKIKDNEIELIRKGAVSFKTIQNGLKSLKMLK